MKVKKKTKKKFSLFKAGGLMLLLSSVVLIIYYFSLPKEEKTNIKTSFTEKEEKSTDDEYITYANNTYGYKVSHKRLIIPKTITTDRYLDFVVFLTDKSDSYGGFAISVRQNDIEDEIRLVKEEIDEGISSEFVSEEDISEGENRIIRLKYAPIVEEEGEEKDIVIINNGTYSYTISARSQDMDEIIQNFSVIEIK